MDVRFLAVPGRNYPPAPARRVTNNLKVENLPGIHDQVRVKGPLDLPHDLDLRLRPRVTQVVLLEQAHPVLRGNRPPVTLDNLKHPLRHLAALLTERIHRQ